ncbi:MAG TPA: hypothetical protein VN901_11910 [Candidatus Acidoferrales bacterium]|nr:hypothetical protein [Candidatus Acidoferrales bacterium]
MPIASSCRRSGRQFPGGVEEWQSPYARDWKLLATSEILSVEGKQIEGLNLPQAVLQKMFRSNAIGWIPGW